MADIRRFEIVGCQAKQRMAPQAERWIASSSPLPPRSGGERSGVGVVRHTLKQRFSRRRPPPPTPPRHAQGRVEGGEHSAHALAISINTVIASEAKQSIAQQAERWIASSQELLAMTLRHDFAISPPTNRRHTRESGVSSTPCSLDSIINVSGILDHPLEPVIGRREAPTRWRVTTIETRLRDLAECFFREVFIYFPPSPMRAQGMPGARCARGLVCNGSGRAHTSIQVTPESPGIPHAMVLTATS